MAGDWFCTREGDCSSPRRGQMQSQGALTVGPEKMELGIRGAETQCQGLPDLVPG